jgi:hypothetical protein
MRVRGLRDDGDRDGGDDARVVVLVDVVAVLSRVRCSQVLVDSYSFGV